jgi:hypothetical protein
MIGKVLTFGATRKMEIIEYTEVNYPNPEIIGRFKAKGKKGAIVQGFHYKSGRFSLI